MSSKASFVLLLFAIIGLAIVPSHAAESHAESYWKAKLGNIPMPRALKDSLQLGSNDGSAKMNYNSGNHLDNINFRGYSGGPPRQRADHLDGINFRGYGGGPPQQRADHLDGINFRGYGGGPPQQRADHLDDINFRGYSGGPPRQRADHLDDINFRGYSGGPPRQRADHLDNINFRGYSGGPPRQRADHLDGINFRGYGGGPPQQSADHLDDINSRGNGGHGKYKLSSPDHLESLQLPQDGRVIFFTDEVLFRASGAKMKLHFSKINNESKFLPFQVAKSLPFSSDKIQVVLNLLSINPISIEARDIKATIEECEEKGVKDEVRYCATSLEGMVDYVTLKLNSGKNKFKVLSTEQDEEILMEYKIQKAQKLGNDENNHNLVCHKMSNPYAVFLCHNIKRTNIYGVSLLGSNGKQMKAIAVCHTDTSSWNPEHLAFQLLKIKPGSKPICHFLNGDAVVWFPN